MPEPRDGDVSDPGFGEFTDDVEVGIPNDGVAALRDVEAEAGDEQELTDLFTLDRLEARELGADLDPVDDPEPALD